MKLENAKRILEEKRNSGDMGTYALVVGYKGETAFVTSPDADKDTYFDIASTGKVLVTTPLILRAVSEGKLSLNDTLPKFFDNVPEDIKSITVTHLLTHTSGIIRHVIPKEICARNNGVIAAHILQFDLGYETGKGYAYSCDGMILLGFILEKVYGKTLDELFYEKIKHPLGLSRARFNIAIDEENSAVSYEREEAGLRRMDDWTIVLMRNGVSGSGGAFWSIDSVRKYVEAVMAKSEVLYSKELYDISEKDYTPDFAEHRGLGWHIDNQKDAVDLGKLFPKNTFGHNGWTGCAVFMNREQNLYAALLSNTRRCLVRKYPGTGGFDKDGNDMVYMAIRDVFDAVAEDIE